MPRGRGPLAVVAAAVHQHRRPATAERPVGGHCSKRLQGRSFHYIIPTRFGNAAFYVRCGGGRPAPNDYTRTHTSTRQTRERHVTLVVARPVRFVYRDGIIIVILFVIITISVVVDAYLFHSLINSRASYPPSV